MRLYSSLLDTEREHEKGTITAGGCTGCHSNHVDDVLYLYVLNDLLSELLAIESLQPLQVVGKILRVHPEQRLVELDDGITRDRVRGGTRIKAYFSQLPRIAAP